MADAPIAYVTDLEGMWHKLASFAEGNELVSLGPDGRLIVRPGAIFVFGGDAIDRGDAGRRIVRTLLEAKRRQPDQVVLLAGNRDLNKLRLWRELDGHPLPRTPHALRHGPRGALLKWIFENTMGARAAFEHRRTELRRETRPDDDEAVAESYLEDLGPSGELRTFLEHCQLAYRHGPTLFVHGGVTEESLFHTPAGKDLATDLDRWIAELNAWYADQLHAFTSGTLQGDAPGWAGVIAYQAPSPGSRRNRGSVVYGRTGDPLNNPLLPPAETIRALGEAGVGRLLVGHTPNGDTPSLLREGDFELIVGDASHSRVEQAPRIALLGKRLLVEGTTRLDDGTTHTVRIDRTLGDADPLGQRDLEHAYLIKGRLEDGRYLLFRYREGFAYEQLAEEARDLERRRLGSPGYDRP